MKRLVALGLCLAFGTAALAARPAAASEDRLSPFLGQFQGQSSRPGNLYVPLWSKPNPFDVELVKRHDELVFAVGAGMEPVILRFVPLSDRLYLLRTDKGGAVRETGYAWVDGDKLTMEKLVQRPGHRPAGMRFVVSFEDDHRRLAAYALKGGDETEVLDTALKGAED